MNESICGWQSTDNEDKYNWWDEYAYVIAEDELQAKEIVKKEGLGYLTNEICEIPLNKAKILAYISSSRSEYET